MSIYHGGSQINTEKENMMKNFKDLHKKQKLSPPCEGGDEGEVRK